MADMVWGLGQPPQDCLRDRPAARQPEAVDTSPCHPGFRCILRHATAPG